MPEPRRDKHSPIDISYPFSPNPRLYPVAGSTPPVARENLILPESLKKQDLLPFNSPPPPSFPRAEGYDVVLLNSNPATIMTDPETANRTYVGPMTPELVEEILIKEKPDALLPTMGGQTALNLTKTLAENGILEKHGVELIGAKLDAINKAEDRQLFKEAMEKIGLKGAPLWNCQQLG